MIPHAVYDVNSMKTPTAHDTPVLQRLWRVFALGLSALVVLLACLAWGSSNQWQLTDLSSYRWFPLFGLVAFSLLWAQYVMLAILWLQKLPADSLQTYFRLSGYAVLAALVLHPSILIWQLWRDGFGLPPESYLRHFVAPGLEWAALLGSFGLLVFLAYELHRWFGDRPWWRFVFYASDAGMLAIVWHGFALGSELQDGWYYAVWIFYAVTLIFALGYLRFLNRETKYRL
jgi:hypothetical protein